MRLNPYGREGEVEIDSEEKEVQVCFSYPDIYNSETPNYLIVQLMHTRAADDIRIHYDGERDGWAIEQASVFQWDGEDKICDPEWKEVAFVQAWASQRVPPPEEEP